MNQQSDSRSRSKFGPAEKLVDLLTRYACWTDRKQSQAPRLFAVQWLRYHQCAFVQSFGAGFLFENIFRNKFKVQLVKLALTP